jgi:hypothetical protein
VVQVPESENLLREAVGSKRHPPAGKPASDWRDLFYLHAFLDASLSHGGKR